MERDPYARIHNIHDEVVQNAPWEKLDISKLDTQQIYMIRSQFASLIDLITDRKRDLSKMQESIDALEKAVGRYKDEITKLTS